VHGQEVNGRGAFAWTILSSLKSTNQRVTLRSPQQLQVYFTDNFRRLIVPCRDLLGRAARQGGAGTTPQQAGREKQESRPDEERRTVVDAEQNDG
jgi:hypothetical protein